MSSVTISVRIPRKLKEKLEEHGINVSKEVRQHLEKLVRELEAERLLKEIEELRSKSTRINRNLAAEFIREDRESR